MRQSEPDGSHPRTELLIVTPVYDDWESFACLLRDIETAMPADQYDVQIIAVDDCSNTAPAVPHLSGCISGISVLRLTMNVGHQRAIAVGLVQADSEQHAARVAIMDADGEDRPAELKQMVDAAAAVPGEAVVAQRYKRSETVGFRLFYWLYVQIFRALTGNRIDFGNFSVLTSEHVGRLVHNANIWNNFAATLIQAKIPIHRVPTARGPRYAGRSHMKLVGLVTHGLGAISVFSDAVFVRILLASFGILAIAVVAVIVVICIRIFTDMAIPGWTTNALGFAVLLSVQAVMLPIMIAFLQLSNRSSFQNIPREHASRLVERRYQLYRRGEPQPADGS
ncbi:glycosyltransferase family 2 protein [Sphingomonas oligophenolica]|uniref:Glycosyltransferase n=1 Tax=Sphingomonas oligophenolica TaxID=301154 RepID=A0ABU9Y9K3_9SPHN